MDMEMHSSNSRPRELLLDGINRKSWWNQRSLLEKMLILIIILLGLLIFGSILYLAVKPSNEKDVCNTRVCLMEASRILEHVDPNIDPCDNFFQFVCGKKLNETLTEWHNRPHAILQDDIESQLLNMLKKPVSSQDTYALKHQKLLFQGCMNETVAEHNSLEIFQEFLKKLKGWPVVVGEEWKEDQLNWTKTILKLRNEGYYHEILIKLVFGYDSEDVGNSILYIYSPRYNLYNDTVNDIDIYKNFMIETATKFGADKHFAEIEMNDVYNLIEKLYMIEEESRYEEDKRITIEEFQNVDNTINWLDFINAYISPARKMSKNTYIMGFGKKFANGLHDLINKTPLRVLYNFIIWKVIEDIMPFLSKEFRELDLRYRCLLRTTVKRVDLCLSLLSNKGSPIYWEKSVDLATDARQKMSTLRKVYRKITLDTAKSTLSHVKSQNC